MLWSPSALFGLFALIVVTVVLAVYFCRPSSQRSATSAGLAQSSC
jgi:ABC-type phosphate transport system permease subunit